MKIVIDATNGILGRIASYAAKQALLGKEVAVVNCAHALVSGRREMILDEYKKSMYRGGHSLKGPFWVKRNPERIMKRTIRGMLSYKQGRGSEAFKRIKCYNETPKEFENEKMLSFKKELKTKALPISELVKLV